MYLNIINGLSFSYYIQDICNETSDWAEYRFYIFNAYISPCEFFILLQILNFV